jgi:hypothetical protein
MGIVYTDMRIIDVMNEIFEKIWFNSLFIIKSIIPLLTSLSLTLVFSSCEDPYYPPPPTTSKIYPYPCPDSSCNMYFYIDTNVSPGSYTDGNGYIRVKFREELNYFTIQGHLEELDSNYLVNKIPLIETQYDSDYWVVFDTLQFTIPMYSYLSWFIDRNFNIPFPIGSRTYTLREISTLHPPLNIAGYQIPRNVCWDCPYTLSLLGTYSKYNYNPRQQFFLDDEMIGDTAQIFIRVLFNNDLGPRVTKDTTFNVIFEQ